MKQIVAILISFLLVGASQAQAVDWRDYPDGGEINCGVVREIISSYGGRTLFRGVPDVRNFTVRLMLDEVFGLCKDDTKTVSNAASRRATPTPRTSSTSSLDAQTIRSLVSRHTKDIRILDIEISSSSITIEYDLKPWHFVPNESIANEVVFKVICALRKSERIPKTLEFIGQGRFKTDLGRKFKSPSVEIHITAATANGVVCQNNSASDINWRKVALRYTSYPVPKDGNVDYD